MIISKLLGGLGNQMFEYSLGRRLSLKYGVNLKLDTKDLLYRPEILDKNFMYRNYDLDIFNINVEVGNFNVNNVIHEPYYHFCPDILKILDRNNLDIYLDGFWQSYKYFEDIKEIIKNDFSFKDKVFGQSDELMNKIKENNSILINIRRTDYLNTNFHGVMGNDYIMKGVDIINSKVDNPHYFIFSDDIEWCKENIKLDNMTIVDHSHKGPKFSFYFQLMIECKHFIIPNSTFAWWSAWLNSNPNKIVISPIKWFNNNSLNSNDLIPKSWIRI